MSQIALVTETTASGKRLPAGTDYSKGLIITGSTTGYVIDDAQFLAASQPTDPLSYIRIASGVAGRTVPANWLGLTMHRWPSGPSPKPAIDCYSWLRTHDYRVLRGTQWWDIETAPGAYDWGRYNAILLNAKNNGKKVIHTLYGTPGFYASAVDPQVVGKEAYTAIGAPDGHSTAPTNMLAFANYVAACCNYALNTRGFAPSDIVMEVSNEPHQPGTVNQYYYSGSWASLAVMCRIAKQVCAPLGIKVAMPAVSKIESFGQSEFVAMLDASAQGYSYLGVDGTGTTMKDWVDIANVHTYTEGDTRPYDYGYSMLTNMAAIRAALAARAPMAGKPLWITENGYLTSAKVRYNARLERVLRLLLVGALTSELEFHYSWDSNTGMGIADIPGGPAAVTAMHNAIAGKTVAQEPTVSQTGKVYVKFTDGTSYSV